MAFTLPVRLPAGFVCSAKQVLNPWEQTLYNLCEEYFYCNQRKGNRHPVLSQVRLNEAIKLSHTDIADIPVPTTIVGDVTVPAFNMKIFLAALSFDILIIDGNGYPKAVFEADGKFHKEPTDLHSLSPAAAKTRVEDWAKQLTRDAHKNAIAAEAKIPLFRLDVEGMHPHLEVVRGTLDNYPRFSRDVSYPTDNGYVQYDVESYPDAKRLIEMEDIELLLVKENWPFPADWEYVTSFDVRQLYLHYHP